MSLRLQLLTFVALTLFLPWAGLRIVQTMEDSLRIGLENSLERSASAVALAVADTGAFDLSGPGDAAEAEPLYLHPLARPPRLDGRLNDWQFMRAAADETETARALDTGTGSRIWLGVFQTFVYLFVEVYDDEVVFQAGPGQAPHGDRVVLSFSRAPGDRRTLLLTAAREGLFRAQNSPGSPRFESTGSFEDVVTGFWLGRDAPRYAIEARVPIDLLNGTLGIGVIDTDGAAAELVASTWNESGEPNRLIGESEVLQQALRPFTGAAFAEGRTDRVRVFDGDGWVLADSGALLSAPELDPAANPTLVEQFFRWVLRREDPEYDQSLEIRQVRIVDPDVLAALEGARATTWYRRGADVSAIVASAVPVNPDFPERGAVLIEEASDPILTLTDDAMLSLVTTTVLISLVAAMALLAYASWLSFRIGRLARAAESALGPRGEIRAALPGARARDEIGDLSRSFEGLLGRLREYTDYLQTLKSKLSHEIRTPLAIVQTSVDNLEHEASSEAARSYLARLRQGTERLESILQAMTAATRVEQAITQTELERFDLSEVVSACLAAYRDVYREQEFLASLPEEPVQIEGSAELIAQLLDKLIDNAVSFATPGTAIVVGIDAGVDEARLSVANQGPPLPEAMRNQLFDSLVSVREARGDKPHLGLGLYIVTLVAEFHGGRVEAENLEDGSGVRISVLLPRSDAGTA